MCMRFGTFLRQMSKAIFASLQPAMRLERVGLHVGGSPTRTTQ